MNASQEPVRRVGTICYINKSIKGSAHQDNKTLKPIFCACA